MRDSSENKLARFREVVTASFTQTQFNNQNNQLTFYLYWQAPNVISLERGWLSYKR